MNRPELSFGLIAFAAILCCMGLMSFVGHSIILSGRLSTKEKAKDLVDAQKTYVQAKVLARGVHYFGSCKGKCQTYVGCNRPEPSCSFGRSGTLLSDFMDNKSCVKSSKCIPKDSCAEGSEGRRLLSRGVAGAYSMPVSCEAMSYGVWFLVEIDGVSRCAYRYGSEDISLIGPASKVSDATNFYESVPIGSQVKVWVLEDDANRCIVGMDDPKGAVMGHDAETDNISKRRTIIMVVITLISTCMCGIAIFNLCIERRLEDEEPPSEEESLHS